MSNRPRRDDAPDQRIAEQRNAPFKYTIYRNDGGTPIPHNEPCFVIRAQDAFALRAIQEYVSMTLDVVPPAMTDKLIDHREQIRRWQRDNPERVKLPD